jgi:hypothetical protein
VLTVGDCVLLEKPLGPIQLYEAMPAGPPVSCMVPPMQTGELLKAVAVGLGLIVTVPVVLSEQVPLEQVTVYGYWPACEPSKL